MLAQRQDLSTACTGLLAHQASYHCWYVNRLGYWLDEQGDLLAVSLHLSLQDTILSCQRRKMDVGSSRSHAFDVRGQCVFYSKQFVAPVLLQVALMESIAVAKTLADRSNYSISPNRELVGM